MANVFNLYFVGNKNGATNSTILVCFFARAVPTSPRQEIGDGQEIGEVNEIILCSEILSSIEGERAVNICGLSVVNQPEHFMKFFLHNKFYATIQGYQSYSECDFQVTVCTLGRFPKS